MRGLVDESGEIVRSEEENKLQQEITMLKQQY